MLRALSRLGVAIAVSPLHQPDSDTKKPHFHCVMTFDGVKSLEGLENLIDNETGVLFDWVKMCNCYHLSKINYPHFIIVNSIAGYYRYLIHLDNSDKQQFENVKIKCGYEGLKDDDKYDSIVHLCGFNNRDYLERDKKISEDMQLVNIITENGLSNERELIYYLALNGLQYLLDYVHKNVYFVKTFIFATGSKKFFDSVESAKKESKKEIKQGDFSDIIPLESHKKDVQL